MRNPVEDQKCIAFGHSATNDPEPAATRVFCKLCFPDHVLTPVARKNHMSLGESHLVTHGAGAASVWRAGTSRPLHTRDFVSHRHNRVCEIIVHENHALEHTLTIVQEFLDVETAKQAGRAGFGAMLACLRADPTCRTILVEKTDRLYRNIRDWITVDDLDLTVHFVKENAVVSKDSRSSEKFMHGIKVLMAKNYVDNLSEEVKKGAREKAEQGHWPSRAPVGYLDNRTTHRIERDAVRGPLIATLFELYATGAYSLKALTVKAHATGLTHPRSGRHMMKAEIHRILQNPIYAGDFRWLGKLYHGSHEPVISRAQFQQVQDVLTRKPRTRYPKQKHPFMGLLTWARCGCAMTAERKKGKYTFYRCTGLHGRCGNTYVREERLADLLGEVVQRIDISPKLAQRIAEGLGDTQTTLENTRRVRRPPHAAAASDTDEAGPRVRGLPRRPDLRHPVGAKIGRVEIRTGDGRRGGRPTLAPDAGLSRDGREDFRTRE